MAVLSEVGQEEARELGEIRAGISDSHDKPWAQSNDGEDRVNLTLELKADQLELDLVGWKENQSDALKDWMQSVKGEDAINALDGYQVVAFAREGYKKTPESRPWWQDETIVELGFCPASQFNAGWVSRQMMGIAADRREVKPAFHIRRAWTREECAEVGDALPRAIAVEVKRLLPILRDIWVY